MRRIIAKASVDFPEPLSPTTPTVSPSLTVKLASLTALTKSTVRLSRPLWIGNQTLKEDTSATTEAFVLIGSGLTEVLANRSFLV